VLGNGCRQHSEVPGCCCRLCRQKRETEHLRCQLTTFSPKACWLFPQTPKTATLPKLALDATPKPLSQAAAHLHPEPTQSPPVCPPTHLPAQNHPPPAPAHHPSPTRGKGTYQEAQGPTRRHRHRAHPPTSGPLSCSSRSCSMSAASASRWLLTEMYSPAGARCGVGNPRRSQGGWQAGQVRSRQVAWHGAPGYLLPGWYAHHPTFWLGKPTNFVRVL